MAMSSISRKEYLREVRRLYKQTKTKKAKGELISDVMDITGMHRKSAIRLLNNRPARYRKRSGPTVVYGEDFHRALVTCWHAANDICAERLQPFLPSLVSKLECLGELKATHETRQLLLSASAATVKRHLGRAKRVSRIPLSTTKSGNLLKSQIAIRHGTWDEDSPGWIETDTVAHGGESAAGQFIYTYNFVDIHSGWTELVATMGKGERNTLASLYEVRARFPFPVLGIDSDNGGEYINNHLYRYCVDEHIYFTRSRPYKKNNNAHVEQKNWEAVRKIVGYSRLDDERQQAILNELYQGPLSLYLNYFQPTRKRKSKLIDTASGVSRKSYFEARTPHQRLMDNMSVPGEVKDLLQSEYNNLNPVQLLAEIRTLIEQLDKSLR
jgi:hypothetical protein